MNTTSETCVAGGILESLDKLTAAWRCREQLRLELRDGCLEFPVPLERILSSCRNAAGFWKGRTPFEQGAQDDDWVGLYEEVEQRGLLGRAFHGASCRLCLWPNPK
jgi:hypothetical protein